MQVPKIHETHKFVAVEKRCPMVDTVWLNNFDGDFVLHLTVISNINFPYILYIFLTVTAYGLVVPRKYGN